MSAAKDDVLQTHHREGSVVNAVGNAEVNTEGNAELNAVAAGGSRPAAPDLAAAGA